MKKEHEEMLKGLELGKGGHLGPRIIETMEKVNKKDKPEERLEVLFDDLLEDALEIAKEPDVEVRVQAVKDMMANKKAWTRTPFYKN